MMINWVIKPLLSTILILFVSCFLFSCTNSTVANQTKTDIPPETEDTSTERTVETEEPLLLNLENTRVYSYNELFQYIRNGSSLNSFCDHFGVENYGTLDLSEDFLKTAHISRNPLRYTVVNTDKCPVLLIFHVDSDSEQIKEGTFKGYVDFIDISLSKDEAEERIKNVSISDTYKGEVIQIDPDGYYELIERSYLSSEMCHRSFHFFDSGNGYIIYYRDMNNAVAAKCQFTIN